MHELKGDEYPSIIDIYVHILAMNWLKDIHSQRMQLGT